MSNKTTKYAGDIQEALKMDARAMLAKGELVPAKLKASIERIEQLEAENARLVEAIQALKDILWKESNRSCEVSDACDYGITLATKAIEGLEQ